MLIRRVFFLAITIWCWNFQAQAAVDYEKCSEITRQLAEKHPRILLPYERFTENSREAEIDSLIHDFWRILEVQGALAPENGNKRERVFHLKTIGGGILAYVEILPGIPAELQKGFFALKPGTRLPALVRFSGGVGVNKPDIFPDVTGLSIKIFDHLLSEPLNTLAPIQTMDWTATKGVSAFARTHRGFTDFGVAMAPGSHRISRFLSYLSSQPDAFLRIISSSFRPYSSVLLQEYGLNHAYALDEQSAFRMRFAAADPFLIQASTQSFFSTLNRALTDRNYLGTDLIHQLESGNVELTGSIQTEDPKLSASDRIKKMEDGLAAWKTPKVPAIRIVLLSNSISAETTEMTNRLGFNPGNYLWGHRPAGNIGRGRVWSYTASQVGRDVPEAEELQQLNREIVTKVLELVGPN